MHAVTILYSSFVPVFIIVIWKPPIKNNDLGPLAGFVTLKPSILTKELMNSKSRLHTCPDPTGNISCKVTGGREIKFQLRTWLTGKSKGEKGVWSDGEFGEEKTMPWSSSVILGVINGCRKSWNLVLFGELVYFQKVTSVKGFQSWKPKYGEPVGGFSFLLLMSARYSFVDSFLAIDAQVGSEN